MSAVRPYVVAIAGLDPSGGAGLAADIKTLEYCGSMGLPVCSAITFQTEDHCVGLSWTPPHQILLQLELVVKKYHPAAAKIGIVQSLDVLDELLSQLKSWLPDLRIVWDPVLRASSGFVFHHNISRSQLFKLLKNIDLVTPNAEEACRLAGCTGAQEAAAMLASHTNVLVKCISREGLLCDLLHTAGEAVWLCDLPLPDVAKHGSGCVLSSAVAAGLSQGLSLYEACRQGRGVVRQYLKSAPGLLGHFQQKSLMVP